jgi:hypothetical protein
MWQLPRERREKTDVTQRESASLEHPSRFEQIVPPPPVPTPAATAFEVHEAFPVELQQPLIAQSPVEVYAAQKGYGVAERADFKMTVVTLLASKSSLRDAILLREILGTPRGLQSLDATL